MDYWNNIYANFDPVAFNLGSISVHWYGIMYVLALVVALVVAKWIVKKDKINITLDELDTYFIYIEVGVILGARLGYVLFYDTHTMYYLTHPWQIFNPFMGGEFVGIRGMSFHGAVIGFFIASILFYKRHKIPFGVMMDVVAIAVPAGYTFGRIGNFLNQELIGRATDVPWGIYVHQILVHPSQLYEAFLEGFLAFLVVFFYRKYKKFDGELIIIFAVMYGFGRFISEFYRQPDIQLGFVYGDWMSMGQAISLIMIIPFLLFWWYKRNLVKRIK
ncbi:MAG: prolipoprotein diacylglyceryl transferase [Helicobacteraceae bacterium]|nr:prolipoprotein diacylglyceryl transferase [Helicobacteraceae bacterium]